METTMQREYVFNLETGKIELHFDKKEYQTLSDEQKRLIKSNFLFSRYSSAWVSRAKEPNLYHAKQAAVKLGFSQEKRQGERLSFAEQVERTTERAEARAERFEGYAENAEHRAANLQKGFNECRKDISWLTQPIISGHSNSQTFARQRQRIIDRYDKGFEEYRKSVYFRDRAATAQNTADMKKFSDPAYLEKRIKECQKNIRALEKNIIHYEEKLCSLENQSQEQINPYLGKYTQENISKWITDAMERIEKEIDKQGYMENCLEEIGGIKFSKENIKPGYIVKIRGYRDNLVIKANPKTVTVKSLISGLVLSYNYGEITEIVKAEEVKPKQESEQHPYKQGEILTANRPSDNSIYKAYQIIKTTDKTIQIQQIEITDDKPQPGQFKQGSKPERKKPTVRSYTNQWAVYDSNEWQLYKYNA